MRSSSTVEPDPLDYHPNLDRAEALLAELYAGAPTR
jgi:hypothetical protein